MSKPITPTAPVTGKDAERIHDEMIRGTPMTPEREKLFGDAKLVFSGLESWLNYQNNKEAVLFYEDEHYYLSNFSAFAVRFNGLLWMTAEHLYQAHKFFWLRGTSDEEIVNEIFHAPSAHEAKQIAKANRTKITLTWKDIKLAAMEEIIRTKCSQHSFVRRKLLETGSIILIENSHKDSFWGRGPDWKGLNHLGLIWMKLRAELK